MTRRPMLVFAACGLGILATILFAPRGLARDRESSQAVNTFSMQIDRKAVNRILGAEVRINRTIPFDPTSPSIPICELDIRIPIEPDGAIARWALAPDGPQRYRSVSLTVYGLRRKISHTWNMPRAFIHSLKEVESSVMGPQHDTVYHLVLRGALAKDTMPYDGSNLVEVQAKAY